MASEYTPSEIKPTGQTDLNGNGGFNVKFSTGEEAFMLAKKAPEVGITEYGEIVDATSKKGTTYKRFKRVQKEEGYVPQTVSQAPQPQASNLEQRVQQLEKDVAFLLQTPQITPEGIKTSQNASQSLSDSADDYLIDDIPF